MIPIVIVRRVQGLSLIECLLACVIAALLAGMTLTSFRSLAQQSRTRLAANEFHQAIIIARTQAISRAERVDIVPAIGHDWRHGWVVLIDTNNNQQPDPGESLLYRSQMDLRDLQVDARLRDTKRTYLAFDAHGRPRSASSGNVPQIGSLVFSVGAARRKLIISFLGRVRLCDPDREASTC